MARGNRGGGRGSPAIPRGGSGGRGGGRGGGDAGGRGSSNYRGRGRGGIWIESSAVPFDYAAAAVVQEAHDKARAEAPETPVVSTPQQPYSPYTPSSTPNFPYQQTPPRARGRGGRGGGGFGPPPPMPAFIIGKAAAQASPFRRSQEEDDAAYASASGSGVETPHFGIGAAKKLGLGAAGRTAPAPSFGSPSGRGGFGGGRGGYVGSNALLKPVKFVKAGTMFDEGDVAVVVQDEPKAGQDGAPSFHVEHYPLSDAAVPQMVDPRHPVEVELTSPDASTSLPPLPALDMVDAAPSPAVSAIDEVEMALELMVVEDTTEDDEDELEVEDETVLPTPEDIAFADEAEASPPPATDATPAAPAVAEVEAEIAVEVEEIVVDVQEEIAPVDADPASLGFFVDVEPATPISPAEESVAESLGFYVDEGPSADPSTSLDVPADDVPTISYSHGAVLGDHIEIDADSDEEQIVWQPKNGQQRPIAPPKASFTFSAPLGAPPTTPSAVSSSNYPITFNDYSPSFTTITTSPSTRKPKVKVRPGKKAQKAAARRSRGGHYDEPPEPRSDSDVEWGSDGPPVSRGEGKSGWKAPPAGGRRGGGGRAKRDAELEAAILADYIENTRGSDGEQDDEGMEQFLAGTQSIEQVEVGDIVLERRKADEERNDSDDGSDGSSRDGLGGGVGEEVEDAGWATDDQDPDGKGGFGEAEEQMMAEESDLSEDDSDDDEAADDSDQAFLDALLAEDSDMLLTDSDDDDSDSDDGLAAAIARTQAQQRAKSSGGPFAPAGKGGKGAKKGGKKGKGKGRMVESSSSEEDTDDEDEMFKGNHSWADEDERFIQNLLDNNADIINGKDRSAQKKLFRAIERGDFEDYEEDFVVAAPTSRKSKHIPAELQSQWDLDRSKKADFKRARQEARLEALLDPYASSSKKSRNKDKTAKRKGNVFSPDDPDSDNEFESTTTRGNKGVTDMAALDREIQSFLRDHGKTTMSLPPMEKESRKRIHLLAECYSIKSNSKGAGKKRFTILIKTSRSSVPSHRGKISRILGSGPGAFSQAHWSSKQNGSHTMPGRSQHANGGGGSGGFWGGGGGGGGGNDAAKRREGEVVGEHAKVLGVENLGHRLLSKMGWSEGGKIGRGEGGLNVPIMATVKTSKLGLGHGI